MYQQKDELFEIVCGGCISFLQSDYNWEMKNKICEKLALQRVVAQYISKNSSRGGGSEKSEVKSGHDNPELGRSRRTNARVFSKILSHQRSFLQNTQQKQSSPSIFDEWLVEVKMPLSSRLFSHEDDSTSLRKDAKELKYELLQEKRREFYGKANLRIRELKRQQKREILAQNQKFRMLFNGGLQTLPKASQNQLSKTFGHFREAKATDQTKLRINSTIVVLSEDRAKVGMNKTGLRFYRTIYK